MKQDEDVLMREEEEEEMRGDERGRVRMDDN